MMKYYSNIKNNICRNFPGGSVVKTVLPQQGAQVRSLVEERRSRMPRGVDKKLQWDELGDWD